MLGWLLALANTPGFMPHGYCFRWTPELLWLYVLGDGLTALAYFSIPPALWYFARKRRDLKFRWLLVLFGLFIVACGTTHLLKLWNIWHSAYWLEAWAGVFTGLVSIAAAVALWPVIPKALALPGTAEMQAAYQALSAQHRQLAHSDNRHRLLLETAAEGIWMVDAEGRITFANSALQTMLGEPGELRGRSLFDFIHAEDRAFAAQKLAARDSGGRERYQMRFRRSDDVPVYTIVSLSPIVDENGAVEGSLGLVTDISGQVQLSRQLEQLNRELEARVEQRTAELEQSNRELGREVVSRQYVQEELKASNEQLGLLLQEMEKHNGDITRLNVLSDQLHGCDIHTDLLLELERGCREFFQCDSGALFEWQGTGLRLLEGPWGPPAGLDQALPPDVGAALREGRLFPDCIEQQDLYGELSRSQYGFQLWVPLHSRGGAVGALVLSRGEPFWCGDSLIDQRQEQIVHALAEHTALALSNLTLRDQLREQSLSDPLTGLYNRRYLYEQMAHEIALWDRSRSPFALILIDIDHFKLFNDRYGHDVGDEVLVALANLLHIHVRRSDIACRLGGEEFVVLLAGADRLQALVRAETIRQAVKSLSLARTGKSEPISISAGVAVFPEHGRDARSLVRAADQALYESKRQGRDRTSLAANS